uniref:Ubiquitin-like domain-containing protein n=1 Tax=Neobodo designis TaxID=312471 RepID=A0A7S1W5Q7_NEODS|mmetsp:Transcript_53723/g.165299  ORF Transcript_53723/g.165299 Transcript_53723/m.165299 type:complete len:188 (+) Transcript_53723:91-654(+)
MSFGQGWEARDVSHWGAPFGCSHSADAHRVWHSTALPRKLPRHRDEDDDSPCEAGERRPKRSLDASAVSDSDTAAPFSRHRTETPSTDLSRLPFGSVNPSQQQVLQVEVLLAWSGRKFLCTTNRGELLPELRRRVLDEAGMRGDWGCGNPGRIRIVCRGRELPSIGGGPVCDHVQHGSCLLVLGPVV